MKTASHGHSALSIPPQQRVLNSRRCMNGTNEEEERSYLVLRYPLNSPGFPIAISVWKGTLFVYLLQRTIESINLIPTKTMYETNGYRTW